MALLVTAACSSVPQPPRPAATVTSCCYLLAENLYQNPLSSTIPIPGMWPSVYGFTPDRLLIANSATGEAADLPLDYQTTPVQTDEFATALSVPAKPPDLSRFASRERLATTADGKQTLYQMDDQLWLVTHSNDLLWSIDRLAPTDATTLADLERALAVYAAHPPAAPNPPYYPNQMTMDDVYALARTGPALTLADFDRYPYNLVGTGFGTRCYEVVGANTAFVRTDGARLASAELLSARSADPSRKVELRSGLEAVTEYLDSFGP